MILLKFLVNLLGVIAGIMLARCAVWAWDWLAGKWRNK